MYRKISYTNLLTPAWYIITFPMDLIIMIYLLIKKKSIKRYWIMKSDVNEIRKVMEPFSESDKNGRVETLDVRYKKSDSCIELKFRFQNIKITDRLVDNFRDGVRINTGLNVTDIQVKKHWMYLMVYEAPVPIDRLYHAKGSVGIGTGVNGLVTWNYDQYPHMLFIGETGTGKSTAIRYLLSSIFSAGLTVWCIDGKVIDYTAYETFFERYEPNENILKVVELIDDFYRDMCERYDLMKKLKVDNYQKIDGMEPKFLLIEEYVSIISRIEVECDRETIKSTKARIGDVIRKGRASGNLVIFSMQRPDAKFIDGEMRDNIQLKLVLGSASKESYDMAFGDRSIRQLERGSGWYKQGTELSILSIPNYKSIIIEEKTD